MFPAEVCIYIYIIYRFGRFCGAKGRSLLVEKLYRQFAACLVQLLEVFPGLWERALKQYVISKNYLLFLGRKKLPCKKMRTKLEY